MAPCNLQVPGRHRQLKAPMQKRYRGPLLSSILSLGILLRLSNNSPVLVSHEINQLRYLPANREQKAACKVTEPIYWAPYILGPCATAQVAPVVCPLLLQVVWSCNAATVDYHRALLYCWTNTEAFYARFLLNHGIQNGDIFDKTHFRTAQNISEIQYYKVAKEVPLFLQYIAIRSLCMVTWLSCVHRAIFAQHPSLIQKKKNVKKHKKIYYSKTMLLNFY